MYQRVLVPLDSTPLSEKVLDSAFRCTDEGGEILVLRVHSKAIDLDDKVICRQELEKVESETEAMLRRVLGAASESKVTIRAEVRSGPLGTTIIDAAKEAESDLIVMGTHGRKGLAQQVMGSVTEQVAAKAPASVFVVKATGFPFLQD